MRVIIAFLRNTTEAAVSAYLDATYPEQREPWVALVHEDACLYIDFYRERPVEFEPEDWADVVRRFGGAPAVEVIAMVSGRHAADAEVTQFITGLLSQFDGAGMDEYSTHLWSLDELRGAHRVQGHPFFDYNGWFA
jgi:hypothetical protein